jgi:hypothetical protein
MRDDPMSTGPWIAPLPDPVIDVRHLPGGRIIIRPGDGSWAGLAEVGEFEVGIYFENDGSDTRFTRGPDGDRVTWRLLEGGAATPIAAVERAIKAMRAEGCCDAELEEMARAAARAIGPLA